MLKILSRRNNFLRRGLNESIKRYFLSNAYKCTEAWENRLKSPALKKIDFENLYHDLDINFQTNVRVNVLDIDLLVNSIKDYNYKNELEDVLLKLRMCPECVIMPDRATHAVIRFYLDNAPKEDLLNLLSDRLNYGMFPDYYLTNLLIDNYLNNKDAVSAVKIAVLQMLQEDFEHPILKALALHSCFNYLNSSSIWPAIKEPEPDPDEEVIKVRVDYIRNPYFDDHFDIKDPNHLVGKTLMMLGNAIGGSLGISSQLIGLVLYEKYSQCADFLENIIKNKTQIHKEAVAKAKEFAVNKPKQVEENSSVEEKKSENEVKSENKDEKSEEQTNIDPCKIKVLELLEKIEGKNLIKGDLMLESENLVKKTIEENEKKDIDLQCQIYEQWEKDREYHIQEEIKRSQLEKLQSEITKTKEELEEEEEKLFFFDNEDKIEMFVKEQEEKMKSVVYYKPSRKEKKHIVDEYIPPDVSQKKN